MANKTTRIKTDDLTGIQAAVERGVSSAMPDLQLCETMDELCDKYGVERVPEFKSPAETTETINHHQLAEMLEVGGDPDAAGLLNMAARRDFGINQRQLMELREQESSPWNNAIEFSDRCKNEKGVVGTPIRSGVLSIERNTQYEPYTLRGIGSDPGLLEDEARTEPSILDALTSAQEIIAAANMTVAMPGEVPRSKKSAVDDIVEWLRGVFANIGCGSGLTDQGLTTYFENASWAALHGFALHEVVWGWDQERYKVRRPVNFSYREPFTLERWLLTHKQDGLAGTIHQAWGDQTRRFSLSARGPRLVDHQLLRVGVNARGNNFEGISLHRPAMHWAKVKRLIGKIIPVTADKWGAPRTYVQEDLEALTTAMQDWDNTPGQGVNDDKLSSLMADLRKAGYDATSMVVPRFAKVRHDYPGSQMPAFVEILNYCDQMINLPWSNEGALYGLQDVGTYALGQVAESRQLRTALYLFRRMALPINGLIRLIVRRYVGELPEYPELVMEIGGVEDRSAWLNDFVMVMNSGAGSWPSAAQKVAAKKLGVDPKAIQDAPEETSPDRRQGFTDMSEGCVQMEDSPKKKSEAIILVGPPASGKSTFYRENFADTHELVSLDVLGSRDKEDELIERLVADNESFVVDNTNATEDVRSKYISMLDNEKYSVVAYFFDTSKEVCIERNKERPDRVPGVAINKICSELEHPTVSEGFDKVHVVNEEGAPFRGSLEFSEFNDTQAREIFDSETERAGAALAAVAASHRRAFADATRHIIDNGLAGRTAAREIRDAKNRVLEEYLPQYEEVMLDEMRSIGEEAQKHILQDHGLTPSSDALWGDITELDPAAQLQALARAEEAANRTAGYLQDTRIRQMEDDTVGLDALEVSTYAAVAALGVGRAYNSGREAVVQAVSDRVEGRTGEKPRIPATYSAVMDQDTCAECNDRNGKKYVYGSKSYWKDHPPNSCVATKFGKKERCRCVMIHDIPDDYRGDLEDLAQRGLLGFAA